MKADFRAPMSVAGGILTVAGAWPARGKVAISCPMQPTKCRFTLDHGGHITHGLPIAFSGKSYNFVQYGVNEETGRLDMEEVRKIALEHKPKMIVAGFTAYPRDIEWKKFKEIADEVDD